MIRNYIKSAWRYIVKNRFSSALNIGGLAVGMAVALLIGLWLRDELFWDDHFPQHKRIAAVLQNQFINNQTQTWWGEGFPLGKLLKATSGASFKHVVMGTNNDNHLINTGDKTINEKGSFFEPDIIDMLSLRMVRGNPKGLNEPGSVLLSVSAARRIFGAVEPVGKTLKIDSKMSVVVTGVYVDLPRNCSFAEMNFISTWRLLLNTEQYEKNFSNPWGYSWFQTLVELNENENMTSVGMRIRDVKANAIRGQDDARFKPELILHPLDRWHLYSEFNNGKSIGGAIRFVYLFGIIGVFVLLLACINFMNLSTARSEKRAREVGIRKAVGSFRHQLIMQFFGESVLIALCAFFFSVILAWLALPFFNQISGKPLTIPWNNGSFWAAGFGFTLVTGIIAGSYPALFLSGFDAVKVLKGSLRAGRSSATPRKALVVLQFSVCIILVVGTIVVFRQVQFARNRPVGYNRSGLVMVPLQNEDIVKKLDVVRNDLLRSGTVTSVAAAQSTVTGGFPTNSGFKWKDKDPSLQEEFISTAIESGFGKTIGWQIIEGRDFSPDYPGDSLSLVINEAAVKYMGLKHPVGEMIEWHGNGKFKIIGVVKNLVTTSPYEPFRQTLFYLRRPWSQFSDMTMRINPQVSESKAFATIAAIFKKYDPETPFSYQFADEEYAKKFKDEQRIGKLAVAFSVLAVFISCLGLFGMAVFSAEQRFREIGIRKVLGASVLNLWRLMSLEFLSLTLLALAISVPLSYLIMSKWLQGYEYRTGVSGWIFLITGAGALVITLLTVSFQSLRVASANPVKSLKSE